MAKPLPWSRGVERWPIPDRHHARVAEARTPVGAAKPDSIAEVFHRAGLIEKWGRGTNRVADMCRTAGVAPPDFAEIAGAAVVTFRVAVAAGEVRPGTAGEVTREVERLPAAMTGAMKRQEMQASLGLKHDEHFRQAYLVPALSAGLIEMTIPDKPKSRLQKYRLTDKGRAWLAARRSS